MNPFAFHDTIKCPECGSLMDIKIEGSYSNKPSIAIQYGIYHCTNEQCMYDHVIERTWELKETTEKQYFHG